MAYDAATYYASLADQAETEGRLSIAAHLRGMAKEAKAKERAAKAAERAKCKATRAPLLGFASAGKGFAIKPY
jgi:hypothetical protein